MNQYLRTDNMTKRILAVRFETSPDSDPDLSWMGEYVDQPGADDVTVDRKARGDAGQRDLRYFVAAMSGEETGNPASVERDYQRMEAYNRGEWYMFFCQAVAMVSINGVMQIITSGGMSGVDSDCGQADLDEVAAQEHGELRSILDNLGFTAEAIEAAFEE